MAQTSSNPGAPRKVLLATDLSARGDRALERAVAIAASQDAHLVILHVFEESSETPLSTETSAVPSWQRPPDLVAAAKRRIRQGLQADVGGAVESATLLIEEGDPAEVIACIAASERVDLIVTGIAGERPFSSRPVNLGRTVEQLLRRLPVPILIVRNRVRAAYQHIVVTTDFSTASAHALQGALRFFPHQRLYLLHASEAPYSNQVDDARLHADTFSSRHADDVQKFLASIFMHDDDRNRIVPVVEPGPPELLIRDYAQMHGTDLVVLGTRGRGVLLEAILGSAAKNILSALPCDALVMATPRDSKSA